MVTPKRATPLISIIVPVLNEEANVRRVHREVGRVMDGLQGRYDFELIFTDNHSTDGTFEILTELAHDDRRVRVLRFSRDFGFQRSILTGYRAAAGDAAIQIDADLQDPPDLIPEFVARWEEGHDVVYGVRRARPESWWLRWVRSSFYRLIDFLSEDHLPHGAGDFRLVSRRVLDLLKEGDDQHPYLRGAIAALGFSQTGIPYDRAARQQGKSKFSLGQLVRLAVDGILAHSIVPLRVATFVGLIMAFAMMGGMVVYLVGRLALHQEWPPGFATTTILLLLGIALNALFLGIIGEYLGRIYQQVKRRPLTIVEATLNYPGGESPTPDDERG